MLHTVGSTMSLNMQFAKVTSQEWASKMVHVSSKF